MDSQIHYVNFQEVTSFRYDTIFLDELVSQDPKMICDYINKRKAEEGIDYIKVRFRAEIPGYNKTVINNYYRNNPNVTVEFMNNEDIKSSKEANEAFLQSEYSYLIDNSISDLERFVRYVNDKEGDEFISVEALNKLLCENI